MKAIEVGKRGTPSRSAGLKVPARVLCGSFSEMDIRQRPEGLEGLKRWLRGKEH